LLLEPGAKIADIIRGRHPAPFEPRSGLRNLFL